jgi:hypothetical protein
MKSVEVNTESRVLRATWTREMVEDLNIHHGLDIEDELSKMLRNELLKEDVKREKNLLIKFSIYKKHHSRFRYKYYDNFYSSSTKQHSIILFN